MKNLIYTAKNSLGLWLIAASGILLAVSLNGCLVRTYSVAKDRVDQDVGGNQGFLGGSAPGDYQKEKKIAQRDTQVVEIEVKNPFKIRRFDKSRKKTAVKSNNIIIPEEKTELQPEVNTIVESPALKQKIYIVQKNDTLQKISARPEIYGTTKKWPKIYEANKDRLSAPGKIYPGQELIIPRD